MWMRIGAVALAIAGAQQRRGVCSQGKTKQWLCLGTVASEREARRGEGSHTQKKIEKERQRRGEREREWEWESGGAGREREHFLEVHSSSLQSSMAFSP